MTTPLVWTVAQTAEALQLSQKHIYRMCTQKRIPHVRIEGSLRFDPVELSAWLAGKTLPAVK